MFGLPTYFASSLFLLRAICALLTEVLAARPGRKTLLLANVLLRLLFDFDTSVNCYMFCSCGLLGSFLFARHVISWYNVLSGRRMFNINRKDCLFLALRYSNAGPRCFVHIIARCVRHKRLTIVFVRFRRSRKAAVGFLRESYRLVSDTFCVVKLFVLASKL